VKQSFFIGVRKAKVSLLPFEKGVIKVFACCGMVTSELSAVEIAYK